MNQFIIPHVPFYFIRHGETQWNNERRIMGQRDIPLNSTGIAQAHQASQRLRDLGIERLVSSPLQRAKNTADIIGSDLNLTTEINEDLSEICWGEWEGKTIDAGYDLEKWVNGWTPLGAESCTVFQQRVIKAFSIVLNTTEKTLIVAHNGVYRALMKAIGHPNCEALNCVPYLFQPLEHSTHLWSIFILSDEGIIPVVSGEKSAREN